MKVLDYDRPVRSTAIVSTVLWLAALGVGVVAVQGSDPLLFVISLLLGVLAGCFTYAIYWYASGRGTAADVHRSARRLGRE
jgi:hypothetical protein